MENMMTNDNKDSLTNWIYFLKKQMERLELKSTKIKMKMC